MLSAMGEIRVNSQVSNKGLEEESCLRFGGLEHNHSATLDFILAFTRAATGKSLGPSE